LLDHHSIIPLLNLLPPIEIKIRRAIEVTGISDDFANAASGRVVTVAGYDLAVRFANHHAKPVLGVPAEQEFAIVRFVAFVV